MRKFQLFTILAFAVTSQFAWSQTSKGLSYSYDDRERSSHGSAETDIPGNVNIPLVSLLHTETDQNGGNRIQAAGLEDMGTMQMLFTSVPKQKCINPLNSNHEDLTGKSCISVSMHWVWNNHLAPPKDGKLKCDIAPDWLFRRLTRNDATASMIVGERDSIEGDYVGAEMIAGDSYTTQVSVNCTTTGDSFEQRMAHHKCNPGETSPCMAIAKRIPKRVVVTRAPNTSTGGK